MIRHRSDDELSERAVVKLLEWPTPSPAACRLVRHYVDLREEVKRHRKRGAQLEEALAFERQMVLHLRVQLDELKAKARACVCAAELRFERDRAQARKERNGSGRHAG